MCIVNKKEQEMNERIQRLVEQAKEESSQWLGSKPATTITYDELEKLAELVVRECMAQLNISNVPAPISAGLNLGKVAIKEHFGVE
jgi:hypothetical protein